MIERRKILLLGVGSGASLFMLAGCGGSIGGVTLPTLPIKVTLPAGLQTIIDDASAAITKVESVLGVSTPQITGLIAKAKGFVDSLTAGGAIDTKSIVNDLVSTLGSVAGLLPAPYGTIALAIETLLPIMGGFVGLRTAERAPTGMTPEQARAVLHG